jgi:hypothetical protein
MAGFFVDVKSVSVEADAGQGGHNTTVAEQQI